MNGHGDRAFVLGGLPICPKNRFEKNVEMIDEDVSCRFSPFDQQDTVPFDQFSECEIAHLCRSVEAVEICVVQNDSSGVVGVHEIERGARHRFVHTQCFAETLSEDGLSRSHFAFQQNDIIDA